MDLFQGGSFSFPLVQLPDVVFLMLHGQTNTESVLAERCSEQQRVVLPEIPPQLCQRDAPHKVGEFLKQEARHHKTELLTQHHTGPERIDSESLKSYINAQTKIVNIHHHGLAS